MAEDGGAGEQTRGAETIAERPVVATGGDDPDRHPDQPRVQNMGVEAARDHTNEEPLQHPLHVAAEHSDEVEDVLDDGEPEPAQRAVDETVQHVVDLVAGDQDDQDDADALQDLLDERRRERRGPSGRELGTCETGDDDPPAGVPDRRQGRGGHGPPDERRHQQRDGLSLVEVEQIDEHCHRRGIQDDEPPGQSPASRRHLAEQALFRDRHDPGQRHDDRVQPERRETRLEEARVMQWRA